MKPKAVAALLALLAAPWLSCQEGSLQARPLREPAGVGGGRLPAAQLWALAAGANLQYQDSAFDRLALGGTVADVQAMLGRQWGVTGSSTVQPVLDSLATVGHTAVLRTILATVSAVPPAQFQAWVGGQRPDLRREIRLAYEHRAEFKNGELLGWDLARLINVARAAYTAGWIDEATAWKNVMAAAQRLQRAYSSWQELSDNYLLGRRFWGGDETQTRFEARARWLLTDPHSPWRRLAWNTPLDG